jgi:hypothetical protein
MAIEEVRDHDARRRMAWVVVWIVLGMLAFVSLVALGHVARDVARSVLNTLGMFRRSAVLLQSAAILTLLVGAIVLPVVLILRIVRARSASHPPSRSDALKKAFNLPTLIFAALLVLAWSAIYQPFGPLATGPLLNHPPSLFYLGLILLAIGLALFVADRSPDGTQTAVARAEESGTQSALTLQRKRREHSYLGAFTVGSLLIIVAVLGLLDSFSAVNIDLRILPALTLTILGAGILVGTWMGRARWLTILCVLTLPFVALANVIDVPIAGGVGSVTYSPSAKAELQGAYRLGVGHMTLDLTSLEATHANATVSASLAAGELYVEVPQGIHVVVDTSVRAGEIQINRQKSGTGQSGLDLRDTSTFASDSPGLIHLIINCGICTVQVSVARAATPKRKSDPGRQRTNAKAGEGKS